MMEYKILFVIMHLIGVAVGAGGAYMSDLMYMSSVKDKILNDIEIRFLKLGSFMTWLGIVILLISGFLLFMTDPVSYMNSDKFILKMIIVAIIIINGFIFHFIHMPVLNFSKNTQLSDSVHFKNKGKLIYVSGAISIISWTFSIILGALRSIPISVLGGFLIYLAIVLIGSFVSVFIFNKTVKNEQV